MIKYQVKYVGFVQYMCDKKPINTFHQNIFWKIIVTRVNQQTYVYVCIGDDANIYGIQYIDYAYLSVRGTEICV